MKNVFALLIVLLLATFTFAAECSVCGPVQPTQAPINPAPQTPGLHAPGLPQPDWTPEPIDDETKGKGTIILNVPVTAIVQINGFPTRSTGARRVYQSNDLIVGEDYRYKIRIFDNGQQIQKEVLLHANETKTVDGNYATGMAISR